MPRPLIALVAASALVIGACSGGGGGKSIEEEVKGVEIVRVGDASHEKGPIDYDRPVPAGGHHNPAWVTCGFYDQVVPNEHAVHDLEHGAIWIAYRPDLPVADIDAIHDIVRANDKVLATAFEELDTPLVLTAWSRQLPLQKVDDPRIATFITTYRDANTAPEAGGSCSNGLGDPIP